MSQQKQQQDLIDFTYYGEETAWPFFALSTIVFGMRSMSRFWLAEISVGWDDVAISISWMLNVVRMVTFQLALSAARRVNQLDPASLPYTVPNATFWALFTDSWAFLSVTLPKVGVAILLVRIFQPRQWVRNTIMTSAIGLVLYCIAGFVICFVQCNPVAGQWDPYRYPNAKCWPRDVQIDYALLGSSSSAFLDLAFAIYPGIVIWQLQMKMWKKLSTMGLMGLGLASFALGVVKVSNNATLLGTPTLHELLTNALHIGLWNSLENDFVMMAACLPSIMPFVAFCRRLPKTGYSFTRSRTRSTRQYHIQENAPELVRKKGPIHVKNDFTVELDTVGAESKISGDEDEGWNRRPGVGSGGRATVSATNGVMPVIR